MLTRLDIYLDVLMYHNTPRYFSEVGILIQKTLIPLFSPLLSLTHAGFCHYYVVHFLLRWTQHKSYSLQPDAFFQ